MRAGGGGGGGVGVGIHAIVSMMQFYFNLASQTFKRVHTV